MADENNDLKGVSLDVFLLVQEMCQRSTLFDDHDLLDILMIESLVSFAQDFNQREADRQSCVAQARKLLEPHLRDDERSRDGKQEGPALKLY